MAEKESSAGYQAGVGTLFHNTHPIATVHYELFFPINDPDVRIPEVGGSLTIINGGTYLPHNGEPLTLELQEGEQVFITVQPKNDAVPDEGYTIYLK
jgi:hypothetical protein